MRSIDFIVQPRLAPAHSLAADSHFLHTAGRPSHTRAGVLRVYDCAGELVSLGRYHCAPPAAPGGVLHRRLSGGRAVPFGEGFVGLSLVLPHRSALVADDPLALGPTQILNRYVRGILKALRLGNVAAFYPGRDFVTVGRRILALVSFEVDPHGALLFEAVIAHQRDFSVLPALLDRADPGGAVKAEMLTADATTCLTDVCGAGLGFDEVADLLRRGYEEQFAVRVTPHALTSLEAQAIAALATREYGGARWLQQRVIRPDLTCHACTRSQLGLFEVYFALEQERFIKEIVFAGDFIANSAAIARLEYELRLCPLEWRAIDAVASGIFAKPENVLLGIGPVRTIAETVMRALAS